MTEKNAVPRSKPTATGPGPDALLTEVRYLIVEARQQTARMVNAGLTFLYWQVGDRVRRELLEEKRADYGEQRVAALGRHLESEFGKGFAEKNLRRMIQFAEVFPEREIVATLSRQLGWSHFGLHPDILPKVADLLISASTCTQLIVTTHSDILVGAMTERPEVILVCEKHERQTVMRRLDEKSLASWLEKYRLGELWTRGELGGTRW